MTDTQQAAVERVREAIDTLAALAAQRWPKDAERLKVLGLDSLSALSTPSGEPESGPMLNDLLQIGGEMARLLLAIADHQHGGLASEPIVARAIMLGRREANAWAAVATAGFHHTVVADLEQEIFGLRSQLAAALQRQAETQPCDNRAVVVEIETALRVIENANGDLDGLDRDWPKSKRGLRAERHVRNLEERLAAIKSCCDDALVALSAETQP